MLRGFLRDSFDVWFGWGFYYVFGIIIAFFSGAGGVIWPDFARAFAYLDFYGVSPRTCVPFVAALECVLAFHLPSPTQPLCRWPWWC
jgi:hypothetical protein